MSFQFLNKGRFVPMDNAFSTQRKCRLAYYYDTYSRVWKCVYESIFSIPGHPVPIQIRNTYCTILKRNSMESEIHLISCSRESDESVPKYETERWWKCLFSISLMLLELLSYSIIIKNIKSAKYMLILIQMPVGLISYSIIILNIKSEKCR